VSSLPSCCDGSGGAAPAGRIQYSLFKESSNQFKTELLLPTLHVTTASVLGFLLLLIAMIAGTSLEVSLDGNPIAILRLLCHS
jgi:hypothetical protein